MWGGGAGVPDAKLTAELAGGSSVQSIAKHGGSSCAVERRRRESVSIVLPVSHVCPKKAQEGGRIPKLALSTAQPPLQRDALWKGR